MSKIKSKIFLFFLKVFVTILVACSLFLLDLNTELGVAFGISYIIFILFSLWFNSRYTYIFTVSAVLLIVLGWYFSPEGGEIWKVLLNRLFDVLSVVVISVVLYFIRKKEKGTLSVLNRELALQLKRNVIIIFLLFIGGFIFIVLLYRNDMINNELRFIETKKEKLLSLKIQTEASLHQLFSDVLFLSQSDNLKNIFNAPSNNQRLINDFSTIMKSRRIYDQIRFINNNGKELIRVNYNRGEIKSTPDDNLQNKKNRPYFKEAIMLEKGELYTSKVDLNIENGKIEEPYKPVIRVATTVFDNEENKIGVLVVNYLANDILQFSKSENIGEALNLELLNESGYWLSAADSSSLFGFLDEEKNKSNSFATLNPKVWNHIKNSTSGVIANEGHHFIFERFELLQVFYNYYNKVAILNTSHTPELIIVSKISKEELAAIKHQSLSVLIITLVLYFLIFIYVIWFFLKKQIIIKSFQEELLSTNNLFKKTQEVAKIGSWSVDLSNMVSYWSDEVYRIHEVELGTPTNVEEGIKFYHPDFREEIHKVVDQAIANDEKWDVEAKIITAKGNEVWIRTVGYPVYINGELKELQGLFMDINDQKLAEIELQNNKQRLDLAVKSGNIGVWDWDIKNNILEWDESMYRLYGLKPENFSGHYEAWEKSLVKEDLESGKKAIEQALTGEKDFDTHFRVNTGEGEVKYIHVMANVIFNTEGEAVRMTGVNIDVTEPKRLQLDLEGLVNEKTNDLQQSYKRLESVNKELEMFSYSVSHDLKAPLRALQGFSANLVEKYDDKLDETGMRWLGFIRSNAERMDNLITDILSFSRIGKHNLVKKEVDTNSIVEKIIKTETAYYKLPVSVNKPKSLPVCFADVALIETVWENLLGNAFKYSSKESAIEITISGEEDDENVYFTVIDNGVGFDMKYYDKLFGIFQRLHNNEEFEGTGVGLANVKRIIEKHGGEISANAEINRGAKFKFSLPKTN